MAGEIFADMDWLHLRPGVATCSVCKARFTYRLMGFRMFVLGLAAFFVLSMLALAHLNASPDDHPLALAGACLACVLIGAFALPLAGLEVVD